MSSREVILDRLKKHSPYTLSKKKITVPDITKGSVEVFTQKATAAGAKVFIVDELEQVKEQIKDIINEIEGDVIYSSEELLRKINVKDIALANQRLAIEADPESVTYYKKQVFTSAVGITSCDYAIAETGSIVIEHWNYNERLISLAPETHICILKADQILENRYMLAKIMEEKIKYPSAYSIITGVSRTADVALQVVLGMHGPKNVFIIVLT